MSRQDARVARIVQIRVAAPQVRDDLLNVGELLRALDLRVRGQDLLDQRRARARQADDENRIRIRRAPAARAWRRTPRADLDLLPCVGLDDLGAIAAFGALQRIALLVVAERLGEVSPGPPAPCRAQNTDGNDRSTAAGAAPIPRARSRFKLVIGEPVGLEVGKTPVGIAEIRAARPPPCGRTRSPPGAVPRVFSAWAIDRCRSASAGVPASSSR